MNGKNRKIKNESGIKRPSILTPDFWNAFDATNLGVMPPPRSGPRPFFDSSGIGRTPAQSKENEPGIGFNPGLG